MAKLPLITAKELLKVLNKLGFKFVRQEGSHMFFKHFDGRATVVPNHPGEHIGSGLLLKIKKPSFMGFLGCKKIRIGIFGTENCDSRTIFLCSEMRTSVSISNIIKKDLQITREKFEELL